MVQTFKEGIKKLSGPLETRFLFAYRTTPQASTGMSPAFLMFGRTLRTRLDLLFPNTAADQVRKSQARMMAKHENRQVSSFKPGDLVYCRNFPSNQPKWIPAEVQATTGPLSYRLMWTMSFLVKQNVFLILQVKMISSFRLKLNQKPKSTLLFLLAALIE